MVDDSQPRRRDGLDDEEPGVLGVACRDRFRIGGRLDQRSRDAPREDGHLSDGAPRNRLDAVHRRAPRRLRRREIATDLSGSNRIEPGNSAPQAPSISSWRRAWSFDSSSRQLSRSLSRRRSKTETCWLAPSALARALESIVWTDQSIM